MPVTLALIVGIIADRMTDLGAAGWIGAAVTASVGIWMTNRLEATRAATLLLLLVCCCLGGLRHHLRWSTMGPTDVSRFAAREPAPIKLVGVIDSPATIEAADHSEMTPPWMQVDRTHCDLQCERLIGFDGDLPATGRLRMIATGHVLHANVGDRVEVTGRLIKPRGALNPGGFDYRSYLRGMGIRCLLDVEHPEAIRLVDPHVTGRLARFRARLRDECEQILVNHLDRQSVPLAMSLLLGERSLLPDDVRDAFAESGMTHVLAISGLHVGILAFLIVLICRGLNASVPVMTVVLLLGIGVFAFVTNHRPPVIRAGVFAATVAFGWPWMRRTEILNLIAVCAVIVLLINPTDLFDVGAQLSFLSVIGISWSLGLVERWRSNPLRGEWTDWLFDPHAGIVQCLLRWLLKGYLVTAAIWFVTLPLIAARFHIVAPVGFLLNVLLIPFVTVILWLGFATLLCGFLAPWIVRWPATAFDESLQLLRGAVDRAADVHMGHVSVAGPDDWWLIGFYGVLAVTMLIRWKSPVRRLLWRGVWLWIILGLLLPFVPPHRDGLRCTFLAVGHGCAVVLELPGGETLLYDAGMFGDAHRGQSTIQHALWGHHIAGIDAIIVSHADVDHFNAAAGLIETMPVGSLFCGQAFLDFSQEPAAVLCETASREEVPIRLLQDGDRLLVSDGAVELTVVHPPPRWRSKHDNANSLVLRVRYAGRTILLTGDLERDGLQRLLAQPPEPIDLMLSPHHGSRKANPTELAAWASPRFVVASGGDATTPRELAGVYARAERVLSTHTSGAVSAQITPAGEININEWIAEELMR